jgi:hypothetical protein
MFLLETLGNQRRKAFRERFDPPTTREIIQGMVLRLACI